ncbi:hypothetical protein [Duganella margarita]|uniref:hypothetical protein n=1 Tax=Duganella margarita TaxID=2692170 RepID=UPI001E4DC6E8|nr:hypothetical protein [Duganella margarita]
MRVGEASDTIQAMQARRSVAASLTTLLSYDYKAQQAVNASTPSRLSAGKMPPLESYDVPGQYAYANASALCGYPDARPGGRRPAVARPLDRAHHGGRYSLYADARPAQRGRRARCTCC